MNHLYHKRAAGFTLIELLVTASITVIITGLLLTNFSRTRVDLNRATISVTDGIREAQSLALTGAAIRGIATCGYGIHFEASGFLIFAEPKSGAGDCASQNRVYDPGSDDRVRAASLANTSLEIELPTDDIFFEPPDPTTYIGGAYSPFAQSIIHVRRQGATCSGQSSTPDCRTIIVTGTGRIQTQ